VNWDWQTIKEIARRWYEKAAAFFLFQNFVGYLVACVAAGHPVKLSGYVAFLSHLFQWPG
jgi:hypothetical protein